jgi:hypothetical protein
MLFRHVQQLRKRPLKTRRVLGMRDEMGKLVSPKSAPLDLSLLLLSGQNIQSSALKNCFKGVNCDLGKSCGSDELVMYLVLMSVKQSRDLLLNGTSFIVY